MALRLCHGCSRHVRPADTRCPFCGDTARGDVPVPVSRATRAAMVFGGAAMVSTAVACSMSATPVYGAPSDGGLEWDSATRDASPAPLYGAVPVDSGVDAAQDAAPDAAKDAAKDAQQDQDASPAPLYGAVPVDSGRD